MPVEPGRRGVGLQRIGKHAHPLKPPALYEVDHLLKLVPGLSRKTRDECRAKHEVGNLVAEFAQELFRRRPVDPPLHPLEHRVAGVLERHVEVGDDLPARGNLFDEPVGEIHRVEVHQPDPLEPLDLLKRVEQFHEPRLAIEVEAVIGRILRDDYELLHPIRG